MEAAKEQPSPTLTHHQPVQRQLVVVAMELVMVEVLVPMETTMTLQMVSVDYPRIASST
jgi:hypothetical protein